MDDREKELSKYRLQQSEESLKASKPVIQRKYLCRKHSLHFTMYLS